MDAPIQVNLNDALFRFSRAREQLRPSGDMWLADIALHGFLEDLACNAEAVVALTSFAPPVHAFPAARGAFEAMQNALMLASSREYARDGARAYVFGLRKDHQILEAHSDALVGLAAQDGGLGWDQLAIHEIAETWEELHPGRAALVLSVVEEFAARHKRHKPDNWSGRDHATELAARLQGTGLPAARDAANLANQFRNAYRVLNRETHPRNVLRPVAVSRDSDGLLNTQVSGRDRVTQAKNSVIITAAALNLGTLACSLRDRGGREP